MCWVWAGDGAAVGVMRNHILMECTTPQTLILLAQGHYAPSAPLACAGTAGNSTTSIGINRGH
eukprot:CAMPEP_0119411652 /NCGR_PEP_ID=MMETSP1335-20130426/4331_1 /TAXON_ID=259385 /ORGANISM="Chrysoculter rhomboideus, Strain RCC1486" /LENGTH=62 /DNA_ID=CAMNT_0007436311 /DNA_START=620 /DNA_END=809 /DNA_ORIENTATION=+